MEGADLVLGGIACGHRPQVVFVAAERPRSSRRRSRRARGAAACGDREGGSTAIFPVDERVAGKITSLESPPPVMAVFPLPPRPAWTALARGRAAPLVYADGIADPGNLGTLVRAAVAFGAPALATSPGSTDLFSPKTVRASMGAVFGLPLLPEQPLGELVAQLRPRARVRPCRARRTPLARADLHRPAVLVVGAERAGLSAAAERAVTDRVTIPLARAAAIESLNAGVAGAIALYEFSCRPAARPTPARLLRGRRERMTMDDAELQTLRQRAPGLAALYTAARETILRAADLDALEQARVPPSGARAPSPSSCASIPSLPEADRPVVGKGGNLVRRELEALVAEREASSSAPPSATRWRTSAST